MNSRWLNPRTFLLALAVAPSMAVAGTLAVSVHTATDAGEVHCALFDSSEGFPMKAQSARATSSVHVVENLATCRFDGLEEGTYAVTVFQDLNGNGKVDTGFLGIPKEPLGFSNGAKIRFGPPAWKDACFAMSGTDATIVISAEPFKFPGRRP
jgi:uncharacterized protein (DUF2141 family)